MALVVAGIDEAGYGPMLGPLCVGLAVLRVEGWTPGEPAPDLWKRLSAAVCKAPRDVRKRVAVADSKRLKLANDSAGRHPLHHLERGVLGFLRTLTGEIPADDAGLFAALGARFDGAAWYEGAGAAIPAAHARGALAIDANALESAMASSGVRLEGLACELVCEREFNRIVRSTGSKAEADAAAIGVHLRAVVERWRRPGDHVRIVCDRLGGRLAYGAILEREVPGLSVRVVEQSEERCRYECEGDESLAFLFMPEAESRHLPVALASMTAKYARELAMARFNRYWSARKPELKPTAGYTTDARRWLREAGGVLSGEEREAMTRIA